MAKGGVKMVKQDAIELISNLPDNVTWNDVIYHLYVRQKIELGKEAVSKGDVYSAEEARRILKDS
jgi:hypothetical protein